MEPYKVMLVRAWRENSLGEEKFHFTAEPAVMTDDGAFTAGCLTTRVAGLADDLDNLMVTAVRNSSDSHMWTFAPHFHDMHIVDLQCAESMVKVLRRVGRAMTVRAERFGAPDSPAQMAAHFTDALSIKGERPFVRYVREMRPDGTHWVHMSTDALTQWLREQEEAYAGRRQPQKWAA